MSDLTLTVTVPGSVVSGVAISREEWINRLLDEFRGSKPHGETVANGLAALIESEGIFILDDDLPDVDSPTYLHMKDAKIIQGEAWQRVGLMRLRISEISGWAPGMLGR